LLSTLQFQQTRQEPVGLVQDGILSQEENKRKNGRKTGEGISATGKAVLMVG
jgi:hypothetical protein